MRQEILALLRERGEYVSGQELCEQFGVSRTAVWKAIEQLKKEGYPIEAVRNRGYLLVEQGMDVYSEQEIRRYLTSKWMGMDTRFFESIGSTNVEARRLADEGASQGLLIVANQQTAGRGRRGRAWISPKDKNIYFTLMLRPEFDPDKASMLTLLMALAVAKGLEKTREDLQQPGKADLGIKWPNDVVIGGKKVTGILTEMSAERGYIHNVVIGVGINVKRQDFDAEFAAHATTIDEAWDTTVNRSMLVANVVSCFETIYEKFLESEDLSGVKAQYEAMMVNRSREVSVLDPKGEFEGIAEGIDDAGELLVRRADNGQVETVYAGEVSVRGLYGYV